MNTKKRIAGLFIFLAAIFILSASSLAGTATNGAQIDEEITTKNGDTAYICQVDQTKLYIEVFADGAVWKMDTANPFAPTVVTVLDAEENELGKLESENGVIDFGIYDTAAKLLCTTAFTGDSYEVELAPYITSGKVQEDIMLEGEDSGQGLNNVLRTVQIISYVVIGIWILIWIVVIPRAIKEGYFSSEKKDGRKAAKVLKNCFLIGSWEMEIVSPGGTDHAELVFHTEGGSLKGILNDKRNKDVVIRELTFTEDSFEGLMNIDIGMNSTPEFKITGYHVSEERIKGEMILTAMQTIKSSFTASKKEV